jgi:polar amino acid transport system substrate-binding protein
MTQSTRARLIAGISLVAAAATALTACSSTSSTPSGAPSTSSTAAVTLPPAFASADLVAPAVTGYPPYAWLEDGKIKGISTDLAVALGGPWGKTVTLKQDSFENAMLGIDTGQYFGVFGADVTADREATYDQVPFLADHYEFMSLAGSSPLGTTMDALCGLKISVVAADSAIPVLKKQSATCTSEGKPAITVQTFADQGAATLAVTSKQTDATTATVTNLAYISSQAAGQFQIGGPKYQYVLIGIAIKKGNGMAQAIADGINALIADGGYATILKTYGVESDAITSATVNPDPTSVGQ